MLPFLFLDSIIKRAFPYVETISVSNVIKPYPSLMSNGCFKLYEYCIRWFSSDNAALYPMKLNIVRFLFPIYYFVTHDIIQGDEHLTRQTSNEQLYVKVSLWKQCNQNFWNLLLSYVSLEIIHGSSIWYLCWRRNSAKVSATILGKMWTDSFSSILRFCQFRS